MRSMKLAWASAVIGIVLTLAFIGDAGAQAAQTTCSSRPGWQLIAAFLLGAFVSAAACLLATRWRRLFGARPA